MEDSKLLSELSELEQVFLAMRYDLGTPDADTALKEAGLNPATCTIGQARSAYRALAEKHGVGPFAGGSPPPTSF